jgi:hypothetical protein
VNEQTQEEVTRPFNYISNFERVMCAPFGLAFLKNVQNENIGNAVFTVRRARF